MSQTTIDDSHDPALRSWVASANHGGADFPIQNLPLGMFRRLQDAGPLRPGVAIGDQVVDLLAAAQAGVLSGDAAAALQGTEHGTLNPLMDRGAPARRALRQALSAALAASSASQAALQPSLVAMDEVVMGLPCRIGDYTDFYTGIHHATTVGKLFRPDNPLLPNYQWVPIGYHGRASSIGVSGQRFHRPRGQVKGAQDAAPRLAPSQRLDYELELGAFIGGGNALGEPIGIDEAEDHWFGLVLLNDWSARDVQAWEYQPLGPFLSKSFASTLSPWIVTPEALAPFRVPFTRPAGDPQPLPLPYLDSAANRAHGQIDIQLEVWLQTPAMRAAGLPHQQLTASNFRDSYWTLAQLITHHTVNGCNLSSGDLLGSGTQSGPAPSQGGSLLELSLGGTQPVMLANGEERRFLEDGDSVMLRAGCERNGYVRIGFGECESLVLPSRAAP
jgi:fumarylacetoacetase